jgi:hypothetical protein
MGAMSSKTGPTLSVWWVALIVGWAAAIGPSEDLNASANPGGLAAMQVLLAKHAEVSAQGNNNASAPEVAKDAGVRDLLVQAGVVAQNAGAPTGAISYGSGDGGSLETAIIVNGARNDTEGVIAEFAYVARLHPDWRIAFHELLQKEGRVYDSNRYRAQDGTEHTLIFDITGYFGK